MPEYHAKYVCRLCGEVVHSEGAYALQGDNVYTAVEGIAMTGGCEMDGSLFTRFNVHECANGDYGLADFHGFVTVTEP